SNIIGKNTISDYSGDVVSKRLRVARIKLGLFSHSAIHFRHRNCLFKSQSFKKIRGDKMGQLKSVFAAIFSLLIVLPVQANPPDTPEREVFLPRRGQSGASSRFRHSSPLLSYHGGPVLKSSNTAAIFWGPQWSNSSFAQDKITGMNAFFQGYSK